MINKDFLNEYFGYSEELMGLYWRKKTSKYAHPKIGNQYRAGVTDSIGYRIVSIFSKPYKEHRLVWIYHNVEILNSLNIDHINRIRDDNRISNLRLVNQSLNGYNRGSKNYTYRKDSPQRPYEASVMIKGKTISKSLKTIEEAEQWAKKQKDNIFNSFKGSDK